MKKFMEARVAHGLEKEQKGERLTLIDPARIPERPFKPNRMGILLIGIIFGTGLGVGLTAVLEYTDNSVRKVEVLTMVTKLPVLAGIPEIMTDHQKKRVRYRRFALAMGAVCLIAGGIIVFHFKVLDLDILWARINRYVNRNMMF